MQVRLFQQLTARPHKTSVPTCLHRMFQVKHTIHARDRQTRWTFRDPPDVSAKRCTYCRSFPAIYRASGLASQLPRSNSSALSCHFRTTTWRTWNAPNSIGNERPANNPAKGAARPRAHKSARHRIRPRLRSSSNLEQQLRDYKIKLAVNAVREHNGQQDARGAQPADLRAYLHRLLRSAGPDVEQEPECPSWNWRDNGVNSCRCAIGVPQACERTR